MTELMMAVLSSGAGEYINKAILVGLFFVFPYQLVRARRVFLNPLATKTVWCLALFGLFFAMVGFGNFDAIKRFFVAPILMFFSGWVIVENNNEWEKQVGKVKNIILAIMAGYCIHALLNYSVNIGNERWNLVDYYSGTYRAATGLGVINTIAFSTFMYCLLEKNKLRKLCGLFFFAVAVLYGLQVGSRTQLLILLIVTVLSLVFYFYQVDNKKAARWAFGIGILFCGAAYLAYQMNLFGIRRAIEMSNLFYRMNADTSHGDGVRVDSILRGLNSLLVYPLGNASQFYFHNMWLDAGRVAGIIAFLLLLSYTILTYSHALSVALNKAVSIEFRVLIFGLYLGLFINYFVEPVLEGMTDSFYLMCIMNGAIEYLYTHQNMAKNKIFNGDHLIN